MNKIFWLCLALQIFFFKVMENGMWNGTHFSYEFLWIFADQINGQGGNGIDFLYQIRTGHAETQHLSDYCNFFWFHSKEEANSYQANCKLGLNKNNWKTLNKTTMKIITTVYLKPPKKHFSSNRIMLNNF